MAPEIEAPERAFLFVHVPKTAGTSFRLAVEELFPSRVMYDYGADSARTSEDVRRLVHAEPDLPKFDALLAERRIVMLAGHLEYSRYAQIFSPARVITFVREPISRLVSEWQHVTRHYGFKGTLLEFAEKPRLRNVQTRVLRGAPLRQLGFIGITERYAESLELFCDLMGWRLRELKRNVKPEQEPVPEISAQELTQLRAWNDHDLRLYERANRIFERCLRTQAQLSSGDTKLARPRGSGPGVAAPPPSSRKGRGRQQKSRAPRAIKRRHTGQYAKVPLPLVSVEHRLALLFTPKAGCTFAVKWYFEQIGLLPEALAYHPWIHRYRQYVFYQSDRYSPENISAPNMRVVKFVRNPFDRAVSSYVHAVRKAYENDGLTRFLGRAVNPENSFSFREFVDYLGSLSLSECNQHHKLQIHALEEEGLVKLDRVVKIEDSQSQVPALEVALGLKSTDLSRLTSSAHHTKRESTDTFCGDRRFTLSSGSATVPESRHFYDAALATRVVELYRKDFDAYGYDTAAPHAAPRD